MLQLRLDLEASGKAIRKKAQQHIIHLLTVRWKALVCNIVHSISTMTVLYSQQCKTFASNSLEDFLNVSEAVINRVVAYDAQHDLQ